MVPLIIGLALFFIGAIGFTAGTWLWAFSYLINFKFIRAGLLFCAGLTAFYAWDMIFWDSIHSPEAKDVFLLFHTIMFFCVLATVLICPWRYLKRRSSFPPAGAVPQEAVNVVPFIKATRQERERVMGVQGHRCANPYCNMDLRNSTPHWDHIKPRSRGGTDSVHNMQWLCDTCNLNKKDMDWPEFLFRYAMNMGMDPNTNQKPWQKWAITRAKNGLQCQG
jgi:hypothetical protein